MIYLSLISLECCAITMLPLLTLNNIILPGQSYFPAFWHHLSLPMSDYQMVELSFAVPCFPFSKHGHANAVSRMSVIVFPDIPITIQFLDFGLCFRLTYDDSSESDQEIMMSLMSGQVGVVLAPLPPMSQETLSVMDITHAFAYIDSWQILAAPRPRSNFWVTHLFYA